MKLSHSRVMGLLPGAATESYPSGAPSAEVLARGSVQLNIYAPQRHDLQQPHTCDELHFVIEGRGVFFDGEHRHAFAPDDCLFAAAGTTHRFEDFTPGLKTWVAFYGPNGGEQT